MLAVDVRGIVTHFVFGVVHEVTRAGHVVCELVDALVELSAADRVGKISAA
jgi:hypothetical protein